MRAVKQEKALEEKQKQELELATAKITLDHGFSQSLSESEFKDMSFDFSQDFPKIEIEMKS